MKRKLIIMTMMLALTASMISGCGKKEEPEVMDAKVHMEDTQPNADPENEARISVEEPEEPEDQQVEQTVPVEMNFFVDRTVSNTDRLLDIIFQMPDDNGNPTMMFAKGYEYSEITLSNYTIEAESDTVYSVSVDMSFSDGNSEVLTFTLQPEDASANTWSMDITAPEGLAGHYLIEGEGPSVGADVTVTDSNVESNYWFVGVTFNCEDKYFRLEGADSNGNPTTLIMNDGTKEETYQMDSITITQSSSHYLVDGAFINKDGGLAGLNFDCQDGEAEVNGPGNMYGHYSIY